MQWLTDIYEKAKGVVQGPVQQISDSTGLPNLTPTDVPPPAPGMTTTGGKMCGGRRRRTHRGKKSKKTIRRKH
jgi:hypothetical protein